MILSFLIFLWKQVHQLFQWTTSNFNTFNMETSETAFSLKHTIIDYFYCLYVKTEINYLVPEYYLHHDKYYRSTLGPKGLFWSSEFHPLGSYQKPTRLDLVVKYTVLI